jgi:hypothetical protein
VCVWVYMYINGGRQRKYSKTLDPISWTRRLRVLQLKIEKNKNNPTYPRKHERRFLQVVPIFLRLQIEKKDLLASNGVQPVWNQPASFQWPTLHSVIITSIGPSCTNLFSLTPTWHTHTHRHRVVVYPHVREMKRLSAKCGTHSLDELDDPVKAIPTAILND